MANDDDRALRALEKALGFAVPGLSAAGGGAAAEAAQRLLEHIKRDKATADAIAAAHSRSDTMKWLLLGLGAYVLLEGD